jgi:hypothetical protein
MRRTRWLPSAECGSGLRVPEMAALAQSGRRADTAGGPLLTSRGGESICAWASGLVRDSHVLKCGRACEAVEFTEGAPGASRT